MGGFGVMFHHFHAEGPPAGQGSITAGQFHKILNWLDRNYRLLDAQAFFVRAIEGKLEAHDICLTFDDALLSQYEVAVPLLERSGLTAFFFIYSGALRGKPAILEVFRFFRNTRYGNFEEFFEDFLFEAGNHVRDIGLVLDRQSDASGYLVEYPFYSKNDRIFRYIRDFLLSPTQYEEIMSSLMTARGFNYLVDLPQLFMSETQVADLNSRGHIVGLHSDTHPTILGRMPLEVQRDEYSRNQQDLRKLLHAEPSSVAYPNGSYNQSTLRIMKSLGVSVGFRSSMAKQKNITPLEIPREDHTNIVRKLGL